MSAAQTAETRARSVRVQRTVEAKLDTLAEAVVYLAQAVHRLQNDINSR